MKPPQNQKTGKTSVQAAEEYLDAMYEASQILDVDKLTRANLRRRMGFDFKIKYAPNKIHVYSEEGPRLSTHCKLFPGDIVDGEIMTETCINRLVDACLRLRIKWNKVAKKL
jgi:hypothetical protein